MQPFECALELTRANAQSLILFPEHYLSLLPEHHQSLPRTQLLIILLEHLNGVFECFRFVVECFRSTRACECILLEHRKATFNSTLQPQSSQQ